MVYNFGDFAAVLDAVSLFLHILMVQFEEQPVGIWLNHWTMSSLKNQGLWRANGGYGHFRIVSKVISGFAFYYISILWPGLGTESLYLQNYCQRVSHRCSILCSNFEIHPFSWVILLQIIFIKLVRITHELGSPADCSIEVVLLSLPPPVW